MLHCATTKPELICYFRIYKNCYAVGIPHSKGKTGILWAAAIGANLDATGIQARLECFKAATPEVIAKAYSLISSSNITVKVDKESSELLVDCKVIATGGVGRCVIKEKHTNVVLVEKNGVPVNIEDIVGKTQTQEKKDGKAKEGDLLYNRMKHLTLSDLFTIAKGITPVSYAFSCCFSY